MPFRSKAQRRWMYANHPYMAKEWEEHTSKGSKLPEHVKKSSMNTQQAYINGFVKRASEYGFSHNEAVELLKQAAMTKALVPVVPASPSDQQMITASPSAGGQLTYKAPGAGAVYTPGDRDFRKIMGSYDPKSRVDRAKADVVRQMYQPGMNIQNIYKHPAYISAGRSR